MSSHHVIRDEQEPPIIILDKTTNIELLKQLLGWSPSVWVVEQVAEWAMSLDFKVDGVLALNPEKHQRIQQQSGQYLLASLEENDVLNSIYKLLEGKLYTGINIFCNEAQKDKILQRASNDSFDLPLTLMVDDDIIIVIKKQAFRKWYPKGSKLKILKGELLEKDYIEKEKNYFVLKNDGIVQLNAEDSIIILEEIV